MLILVAVLAVCFTTDPTTTVAKDTTDKTIERHLYIYPSTDSNNKNNYKNDSNNINHFCLKCKSYGLTFEGHSTSEGKLIQLINCKACSFEWQETWTLPNWFWLKSSSPTSHWTSERWNIEYDRI